VELVNRIQLQSSWPSQSCNTWHPVAATPNPCSMLLLIEFCAVANLTDGAFHDLQSIALQHKLPTLNLEFLSRNCSSGMWPAGPSWSSCKEAAAAAAAAAAHQHVALQADTNAEIREDTAQAATAARFHPLWLLSCCYSNHTCQAAVSR
jgi:hypothetical protein